MTSKKMNAIVCTKYGSPDVLQLTSVEKPSPKDNEILIKINAASITRADGMMRTGMPLIGRLFLGLRKPNNPIPGSGLAGEVEAIGKDVSLFKVGDQVFGESISTFSTYAEYICLPETGILLTKPTKLTYEEAAPVCDGALTSMSFLKDIANIQAGQSVLIIGASGSLGTAAVQLAKHYGAEVTGVCSTKNLELVKSLGADKLIDYTTTDFTKTDESYDIIYDTVAKSSFSASKDSLSPNGIYMSPVLKFSLLLQVIWTSMFGSKKAKFSATGARSVSELKILFKEIKELLAVGKLKTVLDKRYSLADTAEAHRYIDKGHKKGNVVISFS